ncbi:MAG: FkbM family methyltransferase [Bacteroidetes bacterium]|nr:FkbM family methyltransferase [Bacteroidota bacterium]
MTSLLDKLVTIEKLAKAPKWKRLLHSPLRYSFATLFHSVVYPFTKRGIKVKTRTITGDGIFVELPAATDIFLLGAKTHDSEIRLSRYLIKHVQEGDTFIDVGAHIGFYSLLGAKMVGKNGQVVAFEPTKSSFEFLSKNTKNKDQILVINKAVSAEKGVISFFEFPTLYSEYNAVDVDAFQEESWFKKNKPLRSEIPAIDLDSYFQENNILPSFIKIDVEGAEDLVIEGTLQTLEKYSPVIAMEFLSDPNKISSHQKAVKLLQEKGYKTYEIKPEGMLEACTDVEEMLMKNRRTSDNLIFQKPKN